MNPTGTEGGRVRSVLRTKSPRNYRRVESGHSLPFTWTGLCDWFDTQDGGVPILRGRVLRARERPHILPTAGSRVSSSCPELTRISGIVSTADINLSEGPNQVNIAFAYGEVCTATGYTYDQQLEETLTITHKR